MRLFPGGNRRRRHASSPLPLLLSLLPYAAPQVPAPLLFTQYSLLSASAASTPSAPTTTSSSVSPPTTTTTSSSASASSPSLALCNDGSAPSYYYRNCSANWDRHPGDPDFCAVPVVRWVLVFMGGGRDDLQSGLGGATAPSSSSPTHTPPPPTVDGRYCYDARSCLGRSSNLTSSAGLPPSAFPSGVVLPYAEANPDLYKSHSAVIPYCSSDLWAGNATVAFPTAAEGTQHASSSSSPSPTTPFHFRGMAIADAVVDALFAVDGGGSNGLAGADEVLLVGPAGIVARLDALAARIREGKRRVLGDVSATVSVSALCDGCALLPNLTPPANAPPLCTTDADCPPALALPKAAALWNYSAPAWCAAAAGNDSTPADSRRLAPWQCLTAPVLLAATGPGPAGEGATSVPLLVSAQQLDASALASYGAWPDAALNATGEGRAWALDVFGPAVRAVLAPLGSAAAERGQRAAAAGAVAAKGGVFAPVFSPSCSFPPALSLSPSYYHTLAACVDSAGVPHNNSLGQATPIFVIDGAGAGGIGNASADTWIRCEDACAAWGGCSAGSEGGGYCGL
jgi:hypothetical protein